jgi:hypothetical protein
MAATTKAITQSALEKRLSDSLNFMFYCLFALGPEDEKN